MKTLRETYFEQFAKNCVDAVELTRIKNQGYTGGSDDPFKNFRTASDLASLPGKDALLVSQTILSRMADKISRFKSLTVRPDYATADESMLDTLRDLMVYSNILLSWEQLGHPEPGQVQADDVVPEQASDVTPVVPIPPAGSVLQVAAKAGKALGDLFGWPKVTT